MPTSRTTPARAIRRATALAALVAASLLPVHRGAAQAGDPRRGATLLDAGDYPAARAEFDAILKRTPQDANALFYMGRIAAAQERSGEAVDWFEKAIAANDRVAEYHVWLGRSLGDEAMKASKFRQPFLARRVKTEFERAVALDPHEVSAHMGLLQFYAMAPGFMGGGMDKARDQVAQLASFSPLDGHVAAAYLAMRDKDFASAAQEYEGAIRAAPDSALGYLALGGLYQRQERWADAVAVYDRLLARRPDDMNAQFQIGRVAALSGLNLDRGEQAMKLWLAKPPKNSRYVSFAGAHHRLGQIYERRGRIDAARAEYQEALRINPKNDDARKSLAALK